MVLTIANIMDFVFILLQEQLDPGFLSLFFKSCHG